jgi:hypothetical protein
MPTSDKKELLPDNNPAPNGEDVAAAAPVVGKASGLLTMATTNKLVLRIVLVVVVVLVGLVLVSRKNVAKKKAVASRHSQVDIGSVAKKAGPMIAAPTDKRPAETATPGDTNVTPQAIEMTRNPSVEAARRAQQEQGPNPTQTNTTAKSSPYSSRLTGGNQKSGGGVTNQQAKPLNLIHPFPKSADGENNGWQPTPYSGQAPLVTSSPAISQEERKALSEEVTKQSVTFTLSKEQSTGGTQSEGVDYPITNLGLKPGFHIGARTETSASSAEQGVPVIAVVQYNYMRDGKILVPSGSRAIGKMSQADASGYAGLLFSSLQLPGGGTVPISAVALDKNMMPIKGIVTGKNLGKQFLVATMAGLGEATAMMAGGNNMNQAYSESDMVKQQAMLNIGNAADNQVQMMSNGQHIVVTIPAGTEINIVFVKPQQTNKTASR